MKPEEAIGRIREHIRIHSKKEPFTPYLDEAFDMAIEALRAQRPHGKWIYIGISETTGLKIVKCTRCKERQYGSTDFCSNCGADMRKSGEPECGK